jgi:hypothetical protein
MRRIAAIALTAFATAGCIGSGSSASSGSSSAQSTTASAVPRTDVMITYTVPTCPPGARCVQESKTQKYYIVSRQLTCSPAGGNYGDADAACQALSDVVTKLGKKNWVCGCAAKTDGYIPAKAVGYYDGKRRTIPLDGCSLCNLPGVGADVALLLPGIHG